MAQLFQASVSSGQILKLTFMGGGIDREELLGLRLQDAIRAELLQHGQLLYRLNHFPDAIVFAVTAVVAVPFVDVNLLAGGRENMKILTIDCTQQQQSDSIYINFQNINLPVVTNVDRIRDIIDDGFVRYEESIPANVQRSGRTFSLAGINQIDPYDLYDFGVETFSYTVHSIFFAPLLHLVIDESILFQGGSRRVTRNMLNQFRQQFQGPNQGNVYSRNLDTASRFMNSRAYQLFDDKIKSFYYSDFARFQFATPSSTYGLCLVEALEYIFRDGNMYTDGNRRLQKKFAHMFKYEEFIQYLYQHNFSEEENDELLNGMLFPACFTFKDHYPQMNFGIYFVYNSAVYLWCDQTREFYRPHNFNDRYHKNVVSQWFQKTPWWLVYEKMHVVPMRSEQVLNFYRQERLYDYDLQFQQMMFRFVKKNEKLVMQLEQEYDVQLRSSVNEEEKYEAIVQVEENNYILPQQQQNNLLPISDRQYPVFNADDFSEEQMSEIDIIENEEEKEIERVRGYKMKRALTMSDIQQHYQSKSYLKDKYNDVIQYAQARQFNLSGEQLQIAKMKQRRKLDQYGMLFFDFETVTNYENQMSIIGNQIPIVICVCGRAFYDSHYARRFLQPLDQMNVIGGNEEDDVQNNQRVKQARISKVFAGLDCVDQFAKWLVDSGIIASSPFSNKKKYQKQRQQLQNLAQRNQGEQIQIENGSQDYLRKYQNIIIAHNGAQFDFRFLIDKLTHYAQMKITGNIRQIKSIKFKNLTFQDSLMVLPSSLSKLCETFKTRNVKFPYDIVGVTLENWEQKREKIIKYCMMDCLALEEIYTRYVYDRFTSYFNQVGFPKKMFPLTATGDSLDIFKNCYLKHSLYTYPEIYNIEESTYIGGYSGPFSSQMGMGISIDINASYPAAMLNIMPYKPIWCKEQRSFIRFLNPEIVLYSGQQNNHFNKFINYHLYNVTFEFDQETKFPCITVRNGQRLCNPLRQDSPIWIWGIQLNLAYFRQQCKITIFKEIRYEGKRIFNDYIQDLQNLRNQAKINKDDVGDMLYKLKGNSLYGKLAQSLNQQSIQGTYQQIIDTVMFLSSKLQGFQLIDIKPIISVENELYEMKYIYDDYDIKQIGMMKRFASYVTVIGRVNLFRMIIHIDQKFQGKIRVIYGDTDSIFVDITSGFTLEQQLQIKALSDQSYDLIQQLDPLFQNQQKLKREQTLFNEQLVDNRDESQQKISELEEKIKEQIQQIDPLCVNIDEIKIKMKEQFAQIYTNVQLHYQENQFYQQLMEIKDFDSRCCEDFQNEVHYRYINLIDDHITGCYKIEKFIIEGYFLGAKFYAIRGFDSKDYGQLRDKCKMKGVQEKFRQYEHYRRLWQNIFSTNAVIDITNDDFIKNCAEYYEQVQFSRMDTGVRIATVLKIIIPTLVKRRALDRQAIETVPFLDIQEQTMYAQFYYGQYQILKEQYKKRIINQQLIVRAENADYQHQQTDAAIHRQCVVSFVNNHTKRCQLLLNTQVYSQLNFCNQLQGIVSQLAEPITTVQKIINDAFIRFMQDFSQHITPQASQGDTQQNRKVCFNIIILDEIARQLFQNDQMYMNFISYVKYKIQQKLDGQRIRFKFNTKLFEIVSQRIELIFSTRFFSRQFCDKISQYIQDCEKEIDIKTLRRINGGQFEIQNLNSMRKYIVDTRQKTQRLIEEYKQNKQRQKTKQDLRQSELVLLQNCLRVLIFDYSSFQQHRIGFQNFIKERGLQNLTESKKLKYTLSFVRTVIVNDERFLYASQWDERQAQYQRIPTKLKTLLFQIFNYLYDQKLTEQEEYEYWQQLESILNNME